MSGEIACKHCGLMLKFGEKVAGKTIRCPNCEEAMPLPALSGGESSDSNSFNLAEEPTTTTKECPSCGVKMAAEDVFCVDCGYDLVAKKKVHRKKRRKKKKRAYDLDQPRSWVSFLFSRIVVPVLVLGILGGIVSLYWPNIAPFLTTSGAEFQEGYDRGYTNGAKLRKEGIAKKNELWFFDNVLLYGDPLEDPPSAKNFDDLTDLVVEDHRSDSYRKGFRKGMQDGYFVFDDVMGKQFLKLFAWIGVGVILIIIVAWWFWFRN